MLTTVEQFGMDYDYKRFPDKVVPPSLKYLAVANFEFYPAFHTFREGRRRGIHSAVNPCMSFEIYVPNFDSNPSRIQGYNEYFKLQKIQIAKSSNTFLIFNFYLNFRFCITL